MRIAAIPCLFLLVGLALVGFPICSLAEENSAVDFQRDVWPIFENRCNHCHGEDDAQGQLRLDAKAIFLRGGISGKLVQPGEAAASLLFKRVSVDGDHKQMPLDEEPLAAEQLDILKRWINSGAKWPDGVGSTDVHLSEHWAYVRPEKRAFQVKQQAWVKNAIDGYILAKMEEENLSPSPAAPRAILARRVYLDLIGIPPTPEQVDTFLNDASPDAYEKLVDLLLASHEYGQRWARQWLDLARYADTNGYQADQFRSVWPYRDWVINAMNRDMPFDQFTIEQLAGDLLPGATLEQKIATGFHRLTTCNVEAGVDPEENRTNQVIDRVNTTGTVWLGTTIECTQCHNHKYDPFSQKDYYRLFAYFNNTPLEVEGNGVQYNFVGPTMDLPLTAAQQQQRKELQKELDAANEKLASLTESRKAELPAWEADLASSQEQPPEWHLLDIESFDSSGGASHQILDDQSVLVGGDKPATDVYTITAPSPVDKITGFKLETLTHESLPGKGPGRHTAERPNFVLHEFEVSLLGADGKPQPITLHGATADFSQAGWDVAGAIDGKSDSGWGINPQFGKPHEAVFLTSEPLKIKDAKLTFKLDQHHGAGRTIGRVRLSAMTGKPANDAIPENIRKVLGTAKDKRNAKQVAALEAYFLKLDPKVAAAQKAVDTAKSRFDAVKPDTTLVMVEQNKPRETHVFKRGIFLNKGEAVSAGTPRVLHKLDDSLPANRLGLARWIVDPANPLTSRVVVNRWWSEFFGQGIVDTLEDFGTEGDRPTHPNLLDWLACEFIESGWSMKHVHRLIVTSNTYQQSSSATPELREADPQNRLYARGSRIRLSAEMIRDNALAVAGLINTELGGPPVYPPQPAGHWRHVGRNEPKYDTSTGEARYRRGIYVVWRRSAPYPSFTNFDAPDRASCVVSRGRTNTPLQALTLLNDPAYIEMAKALASQMQSIDTEGLETTQARLRYGFRRCVAREPREPELSYMASVFQIEKSRFLDDLAAAKQLCGEESAEKAAWIVLANILLNLDETITRN